MPLNKDYNKVSIQGNHAVVQPAVSCYVMLVCVCLSVYNSLETSGTAWKAVIDLRDTVEFAKTSRKHSLP